MNTASAHPYRVPFELVGSLVGLPIRSESDLLQAARAGLPSAAYKRAVAKISVPVGLIGQPRDLAHRVAAGASLTPIESRRLLRLLWVHFEAAQLFGNDAATEAWMNKPEEFIQGHPAVRPSELAVSAKGQQLLVDRIRRTALGLF